METLFVIAVFLVVLFIVQVLILRWIFRIDEIALYLRQIRDAVIQKRM